MALAVLWVLPVSFSIVSFSGKLQKRLGRKATAAKISCEEGVQECIKVARDLKANNAEEAYLNGLDKKIKAIKKRAVISEFRMAAIVVLAGLILKLGIATVAILGSALLVQGELDVFTFFMFLVVASCIYDPLQSVLEHLAAINSTLANTERLNEVLEHPLQTGVKHLSNQGYDIVFKNVGFVYTDRKNVLTDVSFTAKQGEMTALVGPSGGGKTTISRLAARFWDADKGKITVGHGCLTN